MTWLHRCILAGLVVAGGAGLWAALGDRPAPGGGAGASSRADVALGRLVDAAPDHGFEPLAGDWSLSLPADHGAHPDARMETWIVSAHLEDADGRPTGIHFALSRYGVRRAPDEADGSPWDLRRVHRGHVALVRDGDPAAAAEERFSRGALGAAGHDAGRGEVWLDDWSLGYDPAEGDGALVLSANVRGEALRLALTPVKPAVAGPAGGAALRGFALPRAEARGFVGEGAARRELTGAAWIDRAWGELPMPGAGPVAYDRLLLQLDDGVDLSLLRARRRDGRGTPTIDGVIVGADGTARTVSDPEVAMTPGPARDLGAGEVALDWTVTGAGYELQVSPVVEDQLHAFAQPAWIGLVRVTGRGADGPVTGLGSLQTAGTEDR